MKFLDLTYIHNELRVDIKSALNDVAFSGSFLNGQRTAEFEAAFAGYCKSDHAVGMSNGLDALYAILRALDIGRGDEVIVPAHTFIATWLAVSRTGATIVPVDADPKTMNWDINLVANAITPKTRAIMPVHLYGQMVDMKALQDLVSGTSIHLVEDAAQAHGAIRDKLTAGSAGTAAGFSFYPGKNLGAFGDAGAVTTSDKDLASKVRSIANYGSKQKYEHETLGVNARIDEIQAALLNIKLKSLEKWTEVRRNIAQSYLEELKDIPEIILPGVDSGDLGHVWHLFVIRTEKRNQSIKLLEDRGVPTLIHYPIPNHLSGAYKQDFDGFSYPVTKKICSTCLSLPMGPHLTSSDVDKIITTVREVARKK